MSQKTAKTVTIKFLNKQNRTVKVVEQQVLVELLQSSSNRWLCLQYTRYYRAFREIGKPFLRLEKGGKNSGKQSERCQNGAKNKTPTNLDIRWSNFQSDFFFKCFKQFFLKSLMLSKNSISEREKELVSAFSERSSIVQIRSAI